MMQRLTFDLIRGEQLKIPKTNTRYHVVFDFLEHVVIGHDELLGCVAVGDVGEDAQRLRDGVRHQSFLKSISI